MQIIYSKYACDVCGTTIDGGLNNHQDSKFKGWVRYRIDRIFDSGVLDASDGGSDGKGELCPTCFAKTKIKLIKSRSERK
jgi:hypothetical protein